MRYCSRCRVSLADETEKCPLCGERVLTDQAGMVNNALSANIPGDVMPAADLEKIPASVIRRIVAEIVGISLGIALAVTISVDLVFFRGMTWSRYSTLALVASGLVTIIPLLCWKKPWLLAALVVPGFTALVWLWLIYAGAGDWFMPVGLPVTLTAQGLIIATVVTAMKIRRHGLNVPGIVLCAGSVLCMVIDGCVALKVSGSFYLVWSVVVALSALPVAFLLFYLHYRVTSRATLRKLFRM